jgi:hypothetical protein
VRPYLEKLSTKKRKKKKKKRENNFQVKEIGRHT